MDSGSCKIAGTAMFTPGLTATPNTVAYKFSGTFSGCTGTDPTLQSGTVTASGKGTNLSCTGGQSAGSAKVKWNNTKTSTITFTTTGTGNMITVTGTVTAGTEFKGDKTTSNLTFNANPTQCATPAGVTSAPFSGSGSIS